MKKKNKNNDKKNNVKLGVIFLNKTEYLEDILAAFVEAGISGATVLDSVGMGRYLSQNVPIFTGLFDMFPGSSPTNKTILAVTEEENIEKILRILDDVCEGLDDPGKGLFISLSIDNIMGYKPKYQD